jgi:Excreted virulence factor EspC, type VII ESX diderm
MAVALRVDPEGLRNFAATCEQHAHDVSVSGPPTAPPAGAQSTLAAVSALHSATTTTGDVLASRIRSTAATVSSAADRYLQTDARSAGALDATVDRSDC